MPSGLVGIRVRVGLGIWDAGNVHHVDSHHPASLEVFPTFPVEAQSAQYPNRDGSQNLHAVQIFEGQHGATRLVGRLQDRG